MNEFGDQLPATTTYKVGYYYGKQSAKRWLMTQEDLDLMYKSLSGKKEIMLWCEACTQLDEEHDERGSKHKSSSPTEPLSK